MKNVRTYCSRCLMLGYAVFFVFVNAFAMGGQQEHAVRKRLVMTLDDVIQTARDQSQDALIVKHNFLVNYWEFRTYKAKFLPALNLQANLGQYDHSLVAVQNSQTGEINYVNNDNLRNSLTLSIDQNIPFTGGTVSVYTSLSRLDQFSPENAVTYNSQPINIYYNQPIKAYNSLKWEKKIEPKRFEMAKQTYLENMESITVTVTSYFFDLLLAQGQLDIAKKSYANTELLFSIAKERFQLGTISKDDLLQLQLRLLNDNLTVSDAELDLRMKMIKLRTYLGYNENVDIDLRIPHISNDLVLNYEDVLNKTLTNSSFTLSNEIDKLTAEQAIARAKAASGLQASLFARFGLTQVGPKLNQAYQNPMDQEIVGLSLTLPIMDWGLGKGGVKVAKSRDKVVETQIVQKEQEMREDIIFKVLQFNLQGDQCALSAQADTVGKMRYEFTKERFLNGTIGVTELNTAQTEMDEATARYLQNLSNYWNYYYIIRKLSLFDYIKKENITEDFDKITGENTKYDVK